MNLLRLLCRGSAQFLAKIRLAIFLLCAAVPSPGAAHRCHYVFLIISGSGSLFGVSEKGKCAIIILGPHHLTDYISHLFCGFGWVDWDS